MNIVPRCRLTAHRVVAGFVIVQLAFVGASLLGVSSTEGPRASAAPLATAPSAPHSIIATPTNAAVRVSWTDPDSAGSSPITSYAVSVVGSSSRTSCSHVASTATSCLVTELTNGTSYQFSVTATSADGTSVSSAPSNVAIPDPQVPKQLAAPSVAVGDESLTISWQPPANDGGSPVTSYQVMIWGTVYSFSPTTFTHTFTGAADNGSIRNGKWYHPVVAATNAVGQSVYSLQAPQIFPGFVPDAPATVSAVIESPTSMSVSWPFSLGSSGNGPWLIDSYVVTVSLGSTVVQTLQTPSGHVHQITISNLTPGQTYSIAVSAHTVAGSSPTVNTDVTLALPTTPPGAPRDVTATAGFGQAEVGFTPPSTPSSSILYFNVRPLDTTNPSNVTPSAIGRASPVTVDGLTNGDTYLFEVTAVSIAGNGPVATSGTSVTPHDVVPGAPSTLDVIAGHAALTASFGPPANTGSPIIDYQVTASDMTNPARPDVTVTEASAPIVVSGLTNGDQYSISVSARNQAGRGSAVSSKNPVTPTPVIGVPGAPTAVSAARGDAAATVSFDPASDGGATIESFTVTAVDHTVAGRGEQIRSRSGSPVQVNGLTNGDSYAFIVTATNRFGTGPASSPSSDLTPAGRPSAPEHVLAEGRSSAIAVRWHPALDNGSPISAYIATATPGSRSCTTTSQTACIIKGLTNGTAYTVGVTATNDAGTSSAASAPGSVTPRGTPSTPTGVTVTPAIESLDISWSPSVGDGAPVTGYRAVAAPGGETCAATASTTSCSITGLVAGQIYSVAVTASSIAGASAASDAVWGIPLASPAPPAPSPGPGPAPGPPVAPSAPSISSVSTTATTAIISVTPPIDPGSAPIQGYVIDIQGSGAQPLQQLVNGAVTLNGLTPSTTYSLRVAAASSAGQGAFSDSASATTTALSSAPLAQLSFGASLGQFAAGSSITISGSGWKSDSTSSLSIHSSPEMLGTIQISSDGSFQANETLPKDLSAEVHTLVLTGTSATGAQVTDTWFIAVDKKGKILAETPGPPTTTPPNISQSALSDSSSPSTSSSSHSSIASIAGVPPIYSLTAHPKTLIVALTGAVAALAAVAGAAAAGAAGAAAGAGGAGGGGPGQGRSDSESREDFRAEMKRRGIDTDGLGPGDRSRLWALPGAAVIDRLSIEAPASMGRVSQLLAGPLEDGDYLRAMFGSAWVLLPLIGLILAPFVLSSSHFHPFPPSTTLFAAVLALGILDAFAGLVCVCVIGVVMLFTGHLFSMDALLGFMGLAILWSILPVLIGKVRPLARPQPSSAHAWWVRLGDHLLAPLLAFFFTLKFIEALPGLTGRAVPLVHHAAAMGLVAAVAAIVRILLEDAAVAWFPDRMRRTHAPIVEQSKGYLLVSIALRTAFFGAVMFTLIGARWQWAVLVALYFLYAIFPLVRSKFPSSTWIHRFNPTGLYKVGFVLLVGQLITVALTRGFHLSPIQLIADDLLLVMLVVVVLKYTSGFSGEAWPETWSTRVAGGVVATAVILVGAGVIAFV